MALKAFSRTQEWKASWPNLVEYAGSNLVQKDELLVSVGSPKPWTQNNPFQSVHIELAGSIGMAVNNPAAGSKRFVEPFGPSSFASRGFGKATPTIPSTAEIFARTNPSRASVLLPVFLLELREIPELIRYMGRVLLNPRKWSHLDPARAHLAMQFGWVPLISDLVRIARMQDSVDKRRKEFDRLYSGKGLKRRIDLGGGSSTGTKGEFANFGNYRNFSVSVTETSSWKAWATVHWVPNNPSALPPSDNDIRRRLTGLTAQHITESIWEALPWSWLTDYFINIGAVIKSGNRADARPNGGALMIEYTTIASHPPAASGSDILTMGIARKVERTRAPISYAGITASIPVLEARQLSILGALATVKLLK